jgi:hypothetical protein
VADIASTDDIRALLEEHRRQLLAELDGRVEPYLNSEQAAAFLATTEQSVRWLVANRDLPHRRAQGATKGRLLFRASELERWVEESPDRDPASRLTGSTGDRIVRTHQQRRAGALERPARGHEGV